jgi:hypothetical protein
VTPHLDVRTIRTATKTTYVPGVMPADKVGAGRRRRRGLPAGGAQQGPQTRERRPRMRNTRASLVLGALVVSPGRPVGPAEAGRPAAAPACEPSTHTHTHTPRPRSRRAAAWRSIGSSPPPRRASARAAAASQSASRWSCCWPTSGVGRRGRSATTCTAWRCRTARTCTSAGGSRAGVGGRGFIFFGLARPLESVNPPRLRWGAVAPTRLRRPLAAAAGALACVAARRGRLLAARAQTVTFR